MNEEITKKKMSKFRWFWPWNDWKEEQWLESMAATGWHLEKVSCTGVYTFEHGEPQRVAYRTDFQRGRKKMLATYLQLFADSGWTHKAQRANRHYFSKEAGNGPMPEIFTDNESKIGKIRRQLAVMGAMVAVITTQGPNLSRHGSPLLVGCYSAIILLLAYMVIRMLLRIRQLKRINGQKG